MVAIRNVVDRRLHRRSIEETAKHRNRLRLHSKACVEQPRRVVSVAHHQLQLRDTARAQPRLGGHHQPSAQPRAANRRIDREVIDPSAMPVVTHRHATGDAVRVASQ